jgi:dihydroxyacetone kinase-like protein
LEDRRRAAALGYDQEAVASVSRKALENTRSDRRGLASCIIPEVGRPNYLIEKGTMEFGVGHHGLPGSDTCKLKTADANAEIMLSELLKDMPLRRGDRVALMMSGLATPCSASCHPLQQGSDVLKKKASRSTAHMSATTSRRWT